MYAEDPDFVDSTAAARVNGWIDGCGSRLAIERDLPRVGLSSALQEELRARMRHSAGVAGVSDRHHG
jgi:hypothetical protein